jgi:hypothetical protein
MMAATIALVPAISHAVTPTVSNPKDSYKVLVREPKTIDATSNSFVTTFNLPDTVVTSSAVGKSAVLQLEVRDSDFNYNEVYINPPTITCTDNATDANDNPAAPEGSASIGNLNEHDDINATTEWFANTNAFSSEKLHSGDNTLMICVRDKAGNVTEDPTVSDSIRVRNMMLLYKEE